jgi:alpha-2-macroglobulin
MRKQILPITIVLLCGIFLFISCKKIIKNETWYADAAKYVYAYTSGAIGRNDDIRIRFVNAAIGSEKIGQKIDASLLKINPNIAGDAIWEDDRTIKLHPNEPLPYSAQYKGTLALRQLFPDAPNSLRVFDFDFNVRDLSIEVITDGIRAEVISDLRKQVITGLVRTSDPVDHAALEKILTAKQGNNNLNIAWNHAENGTNHTFSVAGIDRGNVRSKVQLHWSGIPLGTKIEGDKEILIPSLDEFILLDAKIADSDDQSVILNFSDPILATQNLEGIIRFSDYTGALRTVVDANFVRIFPAQRITGTHDVQVEPGLKNIANATLKEKANWTLDFEERKPAVRLVGRGNIIPKADNGAVIFPFEAVGLNAVDVEVFKIFNSNILQFLQVNDMEGSGELERVGKIVLQKKISLQSLNPTANFGTWQRYALDLRDMIAQDPGAIYQIRFAFRRGYVVNTCEADAIGGDAEGANKTPKGNSFADEDELAHFNQPDENGLLKSIMGSYQGIYYNENYNWYEGEEGDEDGRYNWENRENPCKKEFYNNSHFITRNVFVSDLGLIAKKGRDGSAFIAITDILTAAPMGSVDLEFYNYQLQPILKTNTDGSGTMRIEKFTEAPFLMVATKGDRRGYLRMADGSSLSLSRFDVAGVEPQKGLKGFIYGERGVWRPGDSLFLNFVLEDLSGKLPEGHPVTFELTDPKGAMQYRSVATSNVNGVFPFHCQTRNDAMTGNWNAKVLVGGAIFSQSLKIETVKPNKLKMKLDFSRTELAKSDQNLSGNLSVKWLHGAVAKNLKAKVEMSVKSTTTTFLNFKEYVFDDPARTFSSDPQLLYDANINESGQATIPVTLNNNAAAPGKLIASFKTRVFEQSGDFSTDNFSMDYFPYDAFVGIKIPTNQWGSKEIDGKNGSEIRFACVDKKGNPLANKKLEVGLYRCDWRWWWDEDNNGGVAQFNSATHVNALQRVTLNTNAKGEAVWKIAPSDWGRYLIRVSDGADMVTGHCAGDFFWMGYPDNVDGTQSKNAAAMLPFATDKLKYNSGEEVTLKIPASKNGRILVTLETGTKVIDHFWREAKEGENLIKFRTSEDMAPTVYAHVSLTQPHAQTENDLPIRMYGVVPINVENKNSKLEPQLAIPEVLKPNEAFTVNISEKSGKACTYTLAIVDEGLLDLTNFKTPNAWDAFYAKEGLGVKTWDMYDYVLGAYGASLERIMSIGGDGINQKSKNGAQVSRFKPAVRHIGPFYLEKGKTAKHSIKLDNYVGSVRAMLVCNAPTKGAKGAYGMAEKTCAVRQALMIQPTLPRVLGPGETLRLPLNVFAMESKIKSANISVQEISGLVNVSGGAKTLNFSEPGEQMAYFDLKVGNKTGAAKFKISATGSGESSQEEIEILIRNPNPLITKVMEGVVEAGQTWSQGIDPTKFTDVNEVTVEVSAIPPLNLTKNLDYLIQYPHGCIEQTTSAAFPQLYVDIITPLDEKQQKSVQKNIEAALQKYQGFQTPMGGFGYWQGDYNPNDWASSYAGHFLLEAKAKGYSIPTQVYDRWLDYQTKTARAWEPRNSNDPNNWEYHDSELSQAYRVYTLALAGKAPMGDMNRLRERKNLFDASISLLAAAYGLAGKSETANELLAQTDARPWQYDYYGSTYGSIIRDKALRLETFAAIGDKKRGDALLLQLAQDHGKTEQWYSTQELSSGLRAIAKYMQKTNGGEKPTFALKIGNGSKNNISSDKLIFTKKITEMENAAVTVSNTSGSRLYARYVVKGAPIMGAETTIAQNIALKVRYTDNKGTPIEVSKLKQGTDFIAEVTVVRNSDKWFDFNELALTQVFPSGWEIMNARMSDVNTGKSDVFDYQDVRDDRVQTYFDLPKYWQSNQAQQRVYRIQLNASYAGRYYLPAVSCEAMYDNRISASVPGKWVEVM